MKLNPVNVKVMNIFACGWREKTLFVYEWYKCGIESIGNRDLKCDTQGTVRKIPKCWWCSPRDYGTELVESYDLYDQGPILPLRWRHNDQDCVSNHQPHGCLLNRLFRRRSNKTSKLRATGLCVGNSPGPVNSPHKGPVTRKMFPFDDVIMTIID